MNAAQLQSQLAHLEGSPTHNLRGNGELEGAVLAVLNHQTLVQAHGCHGD